MGYAIKFGKAMLGFTVAWAAAEGLGPKLPEKMVVKGMDLRKPVVGGSTLFVLSLVPFARKATGQASPTGK